MNFELDKFGKILLLLLAIVTLFAVNYFTDFFLWDAIIRSKQTLLFGLLCILVWEIFRTVFS